MNELGNTVSKTKIQTNITDGAWSLLGFVRLEGREMKLKFRFVLLNAGVTSTDRLRN